MFEPTPQQTHVELRRCHDLLQIIVENLCDPLAFAILRLGHFQCQFLQLPGPMLQLGRALNYLALQRRRQVAITRLTLPQGLFGALRSVVSWSEKIKPSTWPSGFLTGVSVQSQ